MGMLKGDFNKKGSPQRETKNEILRVKTHSKTITDLKIGQKGVQKVDPKGWNDQVVKPTTLAGLKRPLFEAICNLNFNKKRGSKRISGMVFVDHFFGHL